MQGCQSHRTGTLNNHLFLACERGNGLVNGLFAYDEDIVNPFFIRRLKDDSTYAPRESVADGRRGAVFFIAYLIPQRIAQRRGCLRLDAE